MVRVEHCEGDSASSITSRLCLGYFNALAVLAVALLESEGFACSTPLRYWMASSKSVNWLRTNCCASCHFAIVRQAGHQLQVEGRIGESIVRASKCLLCVRSLPAKALIVSFRGLYFSLWKSCRVILTKNIFDDWLNVVPR
jgi:hypothetical protein